MLLRMAVGSIQIFGYHINHALFPVMIRGQASGMVNFVARPVSAVSTIVTEYTKHPLLITLPLEIIGLFMSTFI